MGIRQGVVNSRWVQWQSLLKCQHSPARDQEGCGTIIMTGSLKILRMVDIFLTLFFWGSVFLTAVLHRRNLKLTLSESSSALYFHDQGSDLSLLWGRIFFILFFLHAQQNICLKIFCSICFWFFTLFLCVFVHFLEVSRALCRCLATSGIPTLVLACQTLPC